MNRLKPERTLAAVVLLSIACAAGAQSTTPEDEDHHANLRADRVHRFAPQQVAVEDFPAAGPILAIGGGGEGVIGRLKGDQVVAIDISRRELEEAPAGPLKIVMDARDLKFLDESFRTAASFFTFMYIDDADHPAVFAEVHRVLAPGGRFLIWGAVFGPRPNEHVEHGLVMLTVRLPGEEVQTGYGARWPAQPHDLAYYERQAVAAGFTVASSRRTDQWFYLELKKP
jgi:SAM-dependent methyltransferase